MAECIIWRTPCAPDGTIKYDMGLSVVKGSPRAGGDYRIKMEPLEAMDDGVKARLTTWLIDERARGCKFPLIDEDAVARASRRKPLTVPERAKRLLRHLVSESSTRVDKPLWISPGAPSLHGPSPLYYSTQAWSESVNFDEVLYFLDELQNQELVRWVSEGKLVVMLDGNARIEEQTTP